MLIRSIMGSVEDFVMLQSSISFIGGKEVAMGRDKGCDGLAVA